MLFVYTECKVSFPFWRSSETHVIASKLIEKADTKPRAGSTEVLGVVPGVEFVSEETNF